MQCGCQPGQRLFGPIGVVVLAGRLLIRPGRFAILLDQLLRVAQFDQDVAATDFCRRIGACPCCGLFGRFAEQVESGADRLFVGRWIGRVGAADAGAAEPEQGLIRQLRMVGKRLQVFDPLGKLPQLHLANSQAELGLAEECVLRILLRKGGEAGQRLAKLAVLIEQHAPVE